MYTTCVRYTAWHLALKCASKFPIRAKLCGKECKGRFTTKEMNSSLNLLTRSRSFWPNAKKNPQLFLSIFLQFVRNEAILNKKVANQCVLLNKKQE